MMLFGVISGEGTNIKGEPTTVENLPVGFRFRGLSYQAFDNAIKSLTDKKRLMANTEIKLSLKRGKNGDNVYYTAVPEIDFTAKNVWRGVAW